MSAIFNPSAPGADYVIGPGLAFLVQAHEPEISRRRRRRLRGKRRAGLLPPWCAELGTCEGVAISFTWRGA